MGRKICGREMYSMIVRNWTLYRCSFSTTMLAGIKVKGVGKPNFINVKMHSRFLFTFSEYKSYDNSSGIIMKHIKFYDFLEQSTGIRRGLRHM